MSAPKTRKEALQLGEKIYDTGVVCKNNHGSIRYSSNGYCCVCSNIKLAEWRAVNKEKELLYKKQYRNTCRGKALRTKKHQDRESRKINASIYEGEEFNDFCLEEAYALSELRTQMTGIRYHVDHVIPLRGKFVCGFHSWNNVQVIPAVENIKKSNSMKGL